MQTESTQTHMEAASSAQMLPNAVLHRFPGKPRDGRDVVVYHKEGVAWVQAAMKGVSFLQIDSAHEPQYHGKYMGPCSLTEPRAQLSAGFEMRVTSPLYWPPPKRGVPRKQQEHNVVGKHWVLAPMVDMPLAAYAAELERLLVTPCQVVAAGTTPEYNVLEPSDAMMYWVAQAFLGLSEAEDEHPSVRMSAWVHYIAICAEDISLEELLSRPLMAAQALAAMELYDAPDEDAVANSQCWHVESELRNTLTVHCASSILSLV